MDFDLTPEGALEIAQRSRGTPRVAGRLLRRVRDFAISQDETTVDSRKADISLNQLEVDVCGLDSMDRRYLLCIANNYEGGPVGIETLAAALAEQRDTIEEVIEPFLIQQGFLLRTSRGRVLGKQAYSLLGLDEKRDTPQMEFLSEQKLKK